MISLLNARLMALVLCFIVCGSWSHCLYSKDPEGGEGGYLRCRVPGLSPHIVSSDFWGLEERLETRISINFLFCLHLHNWPIDTNELTFVLTRQSARSHFPICLLLLCTALPDFPLIANPQVPRMSPGANNQSTWGLLF